MQKILGLDIGAGAVKAVALEASFRASTVRAWRSEPLPAPVEGGPTRDEAVKAALQALALDGWFAADMVVCSLPGARVATHLVTLPFGDLKRVDQTLRFEIEDLIPFEPDEVIWDHHVVARTPSRIDLLVAVARRADIVALLDQLKDAGVDPSVVTFSALALADLFAAGYATAAEPVRAPGAPADAPGEPVVEALVDVGAERTDILVHEGGQARFARSVEAGGAHVTRLLAKALEVPADGAETIKRALPPEAVDATAAAAIDRGCAPLVRELRATFAAHAARTKKRVSRVCLCGGGAQLAGLDRLLSQSLGVPVEPLALAPGRALPDPAALGPAAQALALALRPVAGARAPAVTFRRGPFARAAEAGALKGRIAALAAMAAVLLVLVGVSFGARLHVVAKRDAALDNVLCETTKRILGTCEKDYRVALGKLKGKGSPAAAVPSSSAVEIAAVVTRAFPAGDKAILDDLDISDQTLRLRGDAAGYDTVDALVEELQKSKCFPDVKKGRLVKGKNDRIEFDLEGLYNCGAKPGAKAGS